ncbi:hypothetical protein WI41_06990 [Burkholderia latens]|uniref:Uncharacterized protein n=1 Tax=Burkholderia latens TaxID=488446 RepID=A0AAP1G9G0_9BURK|nr:hypothetical protein DM40_2220 [Burkholderia cenocepacia]KVA11835.1 hypothetical protein WI41_06990 [Burkholderia latens]
MHSRAGGMRDVAWRVVSPLVCIGRMVGPVPGLGGERVRTRARVDCRGMAACVHAIATVSALR